MDWITDPQIWIALVTLTALEVVLGIDNIVFISIQAGKLPRERQAAARRTGLALAVITRLLLLSMIFWVTRLTAPLFTVLENEISWRDLVLIGGGLFLLAKSTHEIHDTLEYAGQDAARKSTASVSFKSVVVQILLLDVVFSLDSVITAIGMAEQVGVMAAAVVLAVGFMLWFARAVSDFVQRHPTVKMLALSFLLLIGVALVADGLDLHIPKGYIYFAMAFSFFVELLNMKLRSRDAPAPAAEAPREG